ncbi:hypothetical protein [Micropruina sp.]|uniref:hypothetical protein n=1 Tax=Micropruina sp. TaxID=2737536 RepID=UPI0039E22443
MAWHWRADDGFETGPTVTSVAMGGTFESQPEAEHWLTGAYQDLADHGVRTVSLYEENRLVYGPMSLEAD